MIAYKTMPDLHDVFDAVPDDRRLAKLFFRHETLDLCRLVGADHSSRAVEHILIGAVRERLNFPDEIEVPTCNCGIGEGVRWLGADRGEAITYGIHGSVASLDFDAVAYTHEGMRVVSELGKRLSLVPVSSGVPNIIVEAAPYDGPGRTLGVTIYFESANDDLYIGHNRQPSVRIIIDTGERWTVDYFRTVMRHEILHAVGLAHSPEFFDLMYFSYTGVHLDHPGIWTQGEVDDRYTINQRAA